MSVPDYSRYTQLEREWFAESVLGASVDAFVQYLIERGYACRSRIFMQPSEDRHGEVRGRPGILQRCRVPLLVWDDRPARLDPRTGVFATDGSNSDTTT